MRQMCETKTGARRRAGSLTASALALVLLAFAPAPALAQAANGAGSCAERYHASLARIAKAEYQGLKEASRTPGEAGRPSDPGLPGNLLFTPVSVGERSREETAALRFAASLARAKGRTGGRTDADAAWMAERLRVALGDYLTQSPSPYLCSGVEDYVAELRGDARRLGPPPIQREALIAAQKAVVSRAVAAALLAMKPVPRPAEKPADAPMSAAPPAADPSKQADALRPTAGLDRVDTTLSTGSTVALPAEDPDLPIIEAQSAEAFETPADLTRATDRLMDAASTGGVLAAPAAVPPVSATPATPAITSSAYPVLARLAEARPVVTGVRPSVSDRTIRLRLAAALSAIEALDYLMRARTEIADPVATAMDATFEAILKAHATDCTCRD